MPILDQDTGAPQHQTVSGFGFSGINTNSLGASEYTLVGIAVDRSGSTAGFDQQITECVKQTIRGCAKSPRADNLLARVISFDSQISEVHGFRELSAIGLSEYDGKFAARGTTVLYDACVSTIDALSKQGEQLISSDYSANGIAVVITDGLDYGSKLTANSVIEAVKRSRMAENLESIVTILVGLNVSSAQVSQALSKLKADAGFDQYIEINNVDPKSFAKLADFIQQSVSSQSQSLGTGSASQPITF